MVLWGRLLKKTDPAPQAPKDWAWFLLVHNVIGLVTLDPRDTSHAVRYDLEVGQGH